MSESNLPPQQRSQPKPVLIMAAVLAALQFVLGGTALAEVLDPQVYGILALVVAAIQVGWGVYTTGQVTPWSVVVAKATPDGNVVAGPAARQTTGVPVVVQDAGTGRVVAPPPDEGGRADLLWVGVVVAVVGLLVWLLSAFDVVGLVVLVVGVVVAVYAVFNRPGPVR